MAWRERYAAAWRAPVRFGFPPDVSRADVSHGGERIVQPAGFQNRRKAMRRSAHSAAGRPFASRPWSAKFAVAFRGLFRALRSQSSFGVHLPIALLVAAAAAILRATAVEWGILLLAIGIVLLAEMFNTALESLARALQTGPHPRVRDALDIASGAVLLASLLAAAIGLTVLGHRAGIWLALW
ncbi:MAG: diacylglycerol kinase [Planctomycetota bacterium]